MNNYQYLSRSTVSTSYPYPRVPENYPGSYPRQQDYSNMQRSVNLNSKKQWYNTQLGENTKILNKNRQIRKNYQTQSNNGKSYAYQGKPSSYEKNQPKSPVYLSKQNSLYNQTYSNGFDLGGSAVYDRNYKKQQPVLGYATSKTDKLYTGDKKLDIQQKYKYYVDAVQKFKQQVEETSKMSEQLKKLKEDRKKRLEAKQKQRELESKIYKQLGQYKQKSAKQQKNNEAFVKKATIQYYSPKQQKNNINKYIQQQSKTLNLDKYKSVTQPSKQDIKKKQSVKYNQEDYKSSAISTLTSKVKAEIFNGEVKDFILGKQLGQGKFGTVYQAFHKPTKSLYAIKKVPKDMIKNHLMVDQFCLQVKLQKFLNHQNILTLFGFFDDKTHIYLILQYMEQGTLFTHLKKNKKLNQVEVATKIKEIASAVHYLHQNQIAHRDIKPQNIVMSHGVCKLCDFGWATVCDERRKTYCGTFDYAPPQILAGTDYDYTVDLWCLGVLTYELLVGKAPFYHISRKQTMKKILNVQKTVIEYPQPLSKTAVSFIQSLIKKDPKQRLSSQQVLSHPFLKNATKTDLKKSF